MGRRGGGKGLPAGMEMWSERDLGGGLPWLVFLCWRLAALRRGPGGWGKGAQNRRLVTQDNREEQVRMEIAKIEREEDANENNKTVITIHTSYSHNHFDLDSVKLNDCEKCSENEKEAWWKVITIRLSPNSE